MTGPLIVLAGVQRLFSICPSPGSAAKALGDEPVQARVWALRVWSILKASVIRRAAEFSRSGLQTAT
jgi:hypothetical protein